MCIRDSSGICSVLCEYCATRLYAAMAAGLCVHGATHDVRIRPRSPRVWTEYAGPKHNTGYNQLKDVIAFGCFAPPRSSATILQNTFGKMHPAFFSRSCSACCALRTVRRWVVMGNTRPSPFPLSGLIARGSKTVLQGKDFRLDLGAPAAVCDGDPQVRQPDD